MSADQQSDQRHERKPRPKAQCKAPEACFPDQIRREEIAASLLKSTRRRDEQTLRLGRRDAPRAARGGHGAPFRSPAVLPGLGPRASRAYTRGPTLDDGRVGQKNIAACPTRSDQPLLASVIRGASLRATSTPFARMAFATEATLRLVLRACGKWARTRPAIST